MVTTATNNKKLNCRRETARCFVSDSLSLEVTQGHSKWQSREVRKSTVQFLRYSVLNNSVTLKSGLEFTQDDWNSYHLKAWGTVSYSHFIATMAVSLAVCEIFSVEKFRDLENWVMGCSRSLKMAPFDRPYTTFYWSAIVSIALFSPFMSYLALNNSVNLKSWLEVTRGHWNWYHLKALVRFPIRLVAFLR